MRFARLKANLICAVLACVLVAIPSIAGAWEPPEWFANGWWPEGFFWWMTGGY